MEDEIYPCPVCGTATDWRLECPGYGRGGKVMVCIPPCGNAIEFFCTNRTCSWWHRTPNNRGDAATMPVAPYWLVKVLAEFEISEDEQI